MVTVALRRVDLEATGGPDILEYLDAERYLLLPNTSGAVDADEAVRIARLARAAGLPAWIKLEVTPEPRYLLPDPVETLRAAERLVADGFTVLPYVNADPVLAKRLEEAGCATVMPLGSWIGSNQGVRTRDAVRIIVEQATVPVVVDAGLGAPSHAAEAMEFGADAVLVNTAIAVAGDPVEMARAFAAGVEAGRRGFLAGRAPERVEAEASSPLTGFLERTRERGRWSFATIPPTGTGGGSSIRSRGRRSRRSWRALPFDTLLERARDGVARRRGPCPRLAGRMERTLEDFAALLSPAAGERLEELAAASRRLTLARFGRTMHLYAPLYLSNECLTTCVVLRVRPRAADRSEDADAGRDAGGGARTWSGRGSGRCCC